MMVGALFWAPHNMVDFADFVFVVCCVAQQQLELVDLDKDKQPELDVGTTKHMQISGGTTCFQRKKLKMPGPPRSRVAE